MATEFGLHAAGHVVLHDIFGKVGGLIALVASVVQIPSDTMLTPLEPDWEGPVDQPNDKYLAMCPRADHPMLEVGATQDGYWSGPERDRYADAINDWRGHEHLETLVCRVGLTSNVCGPVWPGSGSN